MDDPTGKAVGNTLEVIETIESLKGNIEPDIKEIILNIGSYIIKLAGKGDDLEDNKAKMLENITNGKAYNKFLELIEKQGGDISYIKDPTKFEKAKYILPVISDKEGYVQELNAEKVGIISVDLGAGRIKKEDDINHRVGIILEKKISDKVENGEILAYIHADDEQKGKQAVEELKKIYKISENPIESPQYIIEVI